MNSAAQALKLIRDCLERERFIVTVHFAARMERRGLMWPDVMSIVDDPTEVRNDGDDEIGRPRWAVAGEAADGLPLEIICAIDEDLEGYTTVLITIYWD